MKNKLKFFLTVFLTAGLVLSFTACAGGSADNKSSSASSEEKTDASSEEKSEAASEEKPADSEDGGENSEGSAAEGDTQTVELGNRDGKFGYIMELPADFGYNTDFYAYAYNTYYDPFIWTNDMTFYKDEEELNAGIDSFNIGYSDVKTVDGFTVKERTEPGFYGEETQYFIKLEDGTNYACRVMVTHSTDLSGTRTQAILDALKSIRKG